MCWCDFLACIDVYGVFVAVTCHFCLICDACSCKWMCSGSISVSSCKCCMLVSCAQPVAMRSGVFCTFCMLALDAMGDHMVEAYSSMGLVMALYVESIVSLCLPHLVLN